MKTNHYISAAAITGLLIGASSACFAGESAFCGLKPYVGIEVIKTSMKLKDRYGSNIFKKNPVDYNVFVGFNFTEMLGIEAGYESHKKLKRTARIGAGEYIPGRAAPLPVGRYVDYDSTIKSYHPYLGITVNNNLVNFGFKNTNLHFMLGASFSKIKAEQTIFADHRGPCSPLRIDIYKKSKVIPMIKIGISQNINENFSIKGSVNWRQTSKFNIRSNRYGSSLANTGTIKLKDSYGVGLSVIYSL
jgi:opacity protein-like surface antigen